MNYFFCFIICLFYNSISLNSYFVKLQIKLIIFNYLLKFNHYNYNFRGRGFFLGVLDLVIFSVQFANAQLYNFDFQLSTKLF